METWTALPEVLLPESGVLGSAFHRRGCSTLREAARYLHSLPYGRNADRADFRLVLPEGRGTCSTKHALLAALAQEAGLPVRLTLGMFEMCEANTPGVGAVLDRHQLAAIPEAHIYLRYAGRRIDVTRSGITPQADIERFLHEQDIRPDQIGDFKVSFHRQFLREWLSRHAEYARFTHEALWEIREACIAAISQAGETADEH